MIKFFGEAEPLSCRTLEEVFAAVSEGEAEFGAVPVENSQAGSINETYDLLLKYRPRIYAEVNLKVSHCLIALPDEALEDIERVYSHPQALAQCEEFLRKLGAELIPAYDTAGSVKMIKERNLRGAAAVAGRRAAEIYGMKILAENIQTNPHNYTRFFIISLREPERAPRSKTSIVIRTKNVPGALYRCLEVFAAREINLLKLESRPARDRPWEYLFYLDFEGHKDDPPCREALEALKERTTFLTILGSYPRAEDI